MRLSAPLRLLLQTPVWIYRLRCGWLLGHRFLLLMHVGRRTGRRYRTVLEVIEYRPKSREAIVVSGFGRNAHWLHNIDATPCAEVIIGAKRFVAAHRRLDPDEAACAIAEYERQHRLLAPIIRHVLSRLLGWPYDGSEVHRRRFAEQLPVIGFRPRA